MQIVQRHERSRNSVIPVPKSGKHETLNLSLSSSFFHSVASEVVSIAAGATLALESPGNCLSRHARSIEQKTAVRRINASTTSNTIFPQPCYCTVLTAGAALDFWSYGGPIFEGVWEQNLPPGAGAESLVGSGCKLKPQKLKKHCKFYTLEK